MDGERNKILVDIGELAEDAGERGDALFPGGAVEADRGRGLAEGDLRSLLAEVGRRVFFFGADLGLGFDAEIVVNGVAIASVCGEPKGAGDGLSIIGEWELDAVDGGFAMAAMGVVERGRADANLDVRGADMVCIGTDDGAKLGSDGDHVSVCDGVAEEIRRELLFVALLAEGNESAMELVTHRVKQDGRALSVRERSEGSEQEDGDCGRCMKEAPERGNEAEWHIG